jgi:hypothetical protein
MMCRFDVLSWIIENLQQHALMGGDKDLHHLDEIVNMCHIIRILKKATNLTTIRDETKVDLSWLSPPVFPSNILILQ